MNTAQNLLTSVPTSQLHAEGLVKELLAGADPETSAVVESGLVVLRYEGLAQAAAWLSQNMVLLYQGRRGQDALKAEDSMALAA